MVKAPSFSIVALLILVSTSASAAQAPAGHEAAMAFALRVSTQVLTFRQGDQSAFEHMDTQFTPEGWTQFLAHLEGWRDEKGAPTFSSTFQAAGGSRVVDEQGGIVHVRIPGTLVQTQDHMKATYRIAVDVWLNENPFAVRRLTQTTCLGGSKACE